MTISHKLRPTRTQRGYDNRWSRAARAYLREHPLCVMHQARGELVAATLVDHVIPHRGDRELFWARGNWQSLCAHCHSRLKQLDELGTRPGGCDERGEPLAGEHHWNNHVGGGVQMRTILSGPPVPTEKVKSKVFSNEP